MTVDLFPARETIISLGGWRVRWYGAAYAAAFLLAWYLLPRLGKYRDLKLSRDDWLYVVTWGAAGVLAGGRLGFVLLYEPAYFWQAPGEIWRLAGGGMSSHGGFLGVGLALWYASRRLKVDYRAMLDAVIIPAGIGLALGRIGNIINGELFSPPAAGWLAVAGNILITGGAWFYLRKRSGWIANPGKVAGLWLIVYSLLRFGMEFFREVETVGGIPAGILYSVPLMLLGMGLLFLDKK